MKFVSAYIPAIALVLQVPFLLCGNVFAIDSKTTETDLEDATTLIIVDDNRQLRVRRFLPEDKNTNPGGGAGGTTTTTGGTNAGGTNAGGANAGGAADTGDTYSYGGTTYIDIDEWIDERGCTLNETLEVLENKPENVTLDGTGRPRKRSYDADELLEGLPLGHCEGHCLTDNDCACGLRCYSRQSTDHPVPGCQGLDKENGYKTSYCMDPTVLDDLFRLKMYWQEGYEWQMSSVEKWYCMECEGACKAGNDIEVGHCGTVDGSNPDIWWQYRNMTDDGTRTTMLQMHGTELCLEMVDDVDDQKQNRLAATLEECDGSVTNQWFHPSEYGDWDDTRFEIMTASGKCLSQEHHPKKNEDIYGEWCRTARKYDTSYWVKY